MLGITNADFVAGASSLDAGLIHCCFSFLNRNFSQQVNPDCISYQF
jgi:hypothetical protein